MAADIAGKFKKKLHKQEKEKAEKTAVQEKSQNVSSSGGRYNKRGTGRKITKSFSINPDDYKALEQRCAEQDLTLSAAIRIALKQAGFID